MTSTKSINQGSKYVSELSFKHVSVCLTVCVCLLSVCLSVSLSLSLSLSLCLSLSLSVSVSPSLSVSLCLCLSVSLCLSLYLSLCIKSSSSCSRVPGAFIIDSLKRLTQLIPIVFSIDNQYATKQPSRYYRCCYCFPQSNRTLSLN